MPRCRDLDGLPAGVALQPLSQLLAERRRRATPTSCSAASSAPTKSSPGSTPRWPTKARVLRVEAGAQVDAPLHLVVRRRRRPAPTRPGTCATSSSCATARALTAGRAPPRRRRRTRTSATPLAHVHLGARRAPACMRACRTRPTAPRLFARTDAVLGARRATTGALDLELGAALSRHELNVRLRRRRRAPACQRRAAGRRPPPRRHPPGHRAHRPRHRLRADLARPRRRPRHAPCSMAASRSAPAPTAATPACRTRTCCCRRTREIDTQPVLEIHADEVKAAHGATVGQLDADRAVLPALARPARPTQARALLTGGVLPRGAGGDRRRRRCATLLATRLDARAGAAGGGMSRDDRSDAAADAGDRLGARPRRFPAADARGPRQAAGLPRLAPTPAQKPAAVIEAVDDFYRRHNANVSRAVHTLGTRGDRRLRRRARQAGALPQRARATSWCCAAAPPSRSTWSRIRGRCRG